MIATRTELDELKAKVDLAELVRRSGVELKVAGKNLLGKCPFHDDKTASLSVNPQERLWNCFACEAGGDSLRWIQLREELDFPKALARLRELAGSLPAAPPLELAKDPRPEAQGDLMRRVVELYQRGLLESTEAQEYLRSRGLASRELWTTFRLGYADGSLLDLFPSQGPVADGLRQSGLVNERGREHFQGCIVVPIEHAELGIVGFYGRKIDAQDPVPHLYLRGPKRGVFNGKALQHSEKVVVCESVVDALSLWEAGCRHVTCLFGCQMPRDVEQALLSARQLVFCLDGDRTGEEATQRLAGLFSAKGKVCLRTALPQGADPNQVLLEQGPGALARLVAQAKVYSDPIPSNAAVEQTEDGFVLELDGIRYEVAPQPPFQGRLKVLLRAHCEGKRLAEVVELLSSRARQMTVGAMVRRFHRSKDQLEEHLAAVAEESERWVEAHQETPDDMATRKAPEMSQEEREEALRFLQQPRLLEILLEDMEVLGYVGEENSKLLAYLIGLSRKLENPLSGIVISQAGAGKSGLTELVERLTPPEDVVLFSRLSSQALYYMPRDYLRRKLLILEERVGAEAAEYSIRVLQSRQCLTQAVVIKDPVSGKMATRRFEVEGPIAYLETTTNHRINHENATRCFELALDESEEQTRRIHQRQRQSRSPDGLLRGEKAEAILRKHHNAQRLLEGVRVVIPYVDQLNFPSRWLRTRRDHERFLSLVEAAAFLHQAQRVQQELPGHQDVKYIEATVQDYSLAYRLAQDVLAATFHELSRGARDLLEEARKLQSSCDKPGMFFITRREMRQVLDWPDRRVHDAILELVEMEYLGVLSGSQGKTFRYRLLEGPENGPGLLRDLTTPAQLEAMVANFDPLRQTSAHK